jgi:hypothetical protein
MTATSISVQQWITQVVSSSLLTQLATTRNVDLDAPDASDRVTALSFELAELGLDPEYVSQHVMFAMTSLLMKQENSQSLIDGFTDILWSVLGDPQRNGAQPPELYRRTAFYLFIAVLGILDPDIPENVLKHRD